MKVGVRVEVRLLAALKVRVGMVRVSVDGGELEG